MENFSIFTKSVQISGKDSQACHTRLCDSSLYSAAVNLIGLVVLCLPLELVRMKPLCN